MFVNIGSVFGRNWYNNKELCPFYTRRNDSYHLQFYLLLF